MPISPFPEPPSRQDPSTFAEKSDAMLSALVDFVPEANALQEDVTSKASSALDSKNAAAISASEALASKNTAVVSASEALTSKNTAVVSASEALTSKNAAVAAADDIHANWEDKLSLAAANAAASTTGAVTATAAAAAAETARVEAQASATTASANTRLSSAALGLAGSASGRYFRVDQAFGEGVDIYLNNAGAAVWQKAVADNDLAIAEVIERNYPFPIVPISALFSHHTSIQNGRGANNATRQNVKVFARNLYAFPYGPRNQGSGPTTTPFFADGPTKTGTASRIQFTVNTQTFSLWTSSYRPPAGTYTVRCKIKSNDANTYALRFGGTASYTTGSALPGSWTTLEKTIITNGTDWSAFTLLGDGTNTPDLLMDEVQIYNDTAENMPAISAEFPGDDFMPALAFPTLRHAGRLLDNSAATVQGSGVLRVPSYPAEMTFSSCTIIAVASMDTAATNQQLVTTDYSAALGTTNATLAITSAQADGSLDFTGVTPFFSHDLTAQGLHIVGMRVKDGARSAHLDSIELGSAATSFSGFSARMFRVGANNNSETAWQNTFRWRGNIAGAFVSNKYLNDEQYAAECESIKSRIRAAGIVMGDFPAFLIAMGDSQTASFTGGRGPSWAVLQATAGTHAPNLPMRNLAVGGATTENVRMLQMPTALTMIDQITSVPSRRAVCALFLGTNDQVAIVADWNNGVNPFTSLTGWWATTRANVLDMLVARGARVVIATPLPDNASPPANWEAARVALRTVMLAQSAYGVMDFGGTAGLSTVADTAGANFDSDHRHISTVGHLLLKPVAQVPIAAAIHSA